MTVRFAFNFTTCRVFFFFFFFLAVHRPEDYGKVEIVS